MAPCIPLNNVLPDVSTVVKPTTVAPKVMSNTKSLAKVENKIVRKVETNAETKLEANAKVETKLDANAKVEAKLEANAKVETNAEKKVETKLETNANAETKLDANTKLEAKKEVSEPSVKDVLVDDYTILPYSKVNDELINSIESITRTVEGVSNRIYITYENGSNNVLNMILFNTGGINYINFNDHVIPMDMFSSAKTIVNHDNYVSIVFNNVFKIYTVTPMSLIIRAFSDNLEDLLPSMEEEPTTDDDTHFAVLTFTGVLFSLGMVFTAVAVNFSYFYPDYLNNNQLFLS